MLATVVNFRAAAWQLVNTISYKPLVGISSNSVFRCSWGQRRTDEILRTEGQRSSLRRDQMYYYGRGTLINVSLSETI